MTSVENLEKFIKSVKDLAKKSSNFSEFYDMAHLMPWNKVMSRKEFDRLVSVASVEAGLENTD